MLAIAVRPEPGFLAVGRVGAPRPATQGTMMDDGRALVRNRCPPQAGGGIARRSRIRRGWLVNIDGRLVCDLQWSDPRALL